MSLLSNIAVSALTGAVAAGAVVLAGSVSLQDATPGATETGHSHISGYSLAGRFGANTSPTLARVQVSETGSLQGVRSVTGTGVSVYGQSTAASGLGAGGYFTSESVGGRGIVGDALSSTGNTVGGLFYNRSTGGGVGVWGRAIGGGTATGVLGETTSATGTGLVASNTSTGDQMLAAGPNGSLLTIGKLPRHQYAVGSNAPMVPIAYGLVDSVGAIFSVGSNNWTPSRTAVGTYTVTVTGVTLNLADSVIMVTDYDSTSPEEIVASVAGGSAQVKIFDSANAAIDSAFYFVVYSTATGVGPGMNTPDTSKLAKYGGIENWLKKDPRGYEAWRRESVARQRASLEGRAYQTPPDESPRP